MSQHEVDATWYSLEELHQITESCCNDQTTSLNGGKTLKEIKNCVRGLESHGNTSQSIAQKMNRNLAYQLAFDEQERQLRNRIHDEEALSRVYHAACSGSCLWARVIGFQDQKDVDNFNDAQEATMMQNTS